MSAATPVRLGLAGRVDCSPWREGLSGCDGVKLLTGLDATLREFLKAGTLDAALLGPESLAELPGDMAVLDGGCVACPGESVTDRVLSRIALPDVRALASCGEHVSTAGAAVRCLWQDAYGHAPPIIPAAGINNVEHAEAVLWTGACGPTPPGFRHSLDIGRMWQEATGLPLVWRVWLAGENVDVPRIDARLRDARRNFGRFMGDLAVRQAKQTGWDARLVRRVLAEMRSYELGDDERDAVHELLFRLRQLQATV